MQLSCKRERPHSVVAAGYRPTELQHPLFLVEENFIFSLSPGPTAIYASPMHDLLPGEQSDYKGEKNRPIQ